MESLKVDIRVRFYFAFLHCDFVQLFYENASDPNFGAFSRAKTEEMQLKN
jgi:hypothetical protein